MTAITFDDGELRNVRLYGVLGAKFGRLHRLAVKSTAEAIRALCVMVKGFQQYLAESKDKGLTFAIFIGKNNTSRDELKFHSKGDIRIAPIVRGRKAGVLQTILGIVLIIVGAIAKSPQIIGLGVSLAAGGVIQMLSPHPKTNQNGDSAANTPNYAFSGPVNTQAQGNPVPVFYGGPLVIGGAIISAAIDVKFGAIVPTSTAASGGGAGTGGGGGGGASSIFGHPQ